MSSAPTCDGARMRAAIARDQTQHWKRLFWAPAKTKKELARRETMWFWCGSIGWQAEVAARTLARQAERGSGRGE